MRKKLLAVAALTVAALFIFVPKTKAADQLLLGQNHDYSVVFRGNGEAIVYARLVVTNSDETPLTKYSFKVPQVTPTEMVMFQQELGRVCKQYDYTAGNKCAAYTDPDYNQSYYSLYGSGEEAKYTKIKFQQSGDQYSFDLPKAIEPYKSGAVIVSYAAKGYVKESMGLFSFDLQTLKVDKRISNLQVSIDVDSDLQLAGKKSEVQYKTGEVADLKAATPDSVSSRDLDRVAGSIGRGGVLVKQAKNLAPDESYRVTGQYARSWWRLYLLQILGALLLVAAILKGLWWWSRHHQVDAGAVKQTAPKAALPSSMSFLDAHAAVHGLLSAALVLGLSYAVDWITNNQYQWNLPQMFNMVIIAIVFLLYAAVLLGPAIMYGMRRGWKAGLWVVIWEIVWLLLLGGIYLAWFQTGTSPGEVYPTM
jgi:hypothetical protein